MGGRGCGYVCENKGGREVEVQRRFTFILPKANPNLVTTKVLPVARGVVLAWEFVGTLI